MRWMLASSACLALLASPVLRAEEEASTATETAAEAKAPPAKSQGIDLFLAPVKTEGDPQADALRPVIEGLVAGAVAGVEEVRLTLSGKLPELDRRFADHSTTDGMDRLALIDLKNQTGVDGVIFVDLRWEGGPVELRLKLVDLRNGLLFYREKLLLPVSSELFGKLEEAVGSFAVSIRRSIRVTVQVTSEPDKSRVWINGKQVGMTPLVVELRTGSYEITVEREGYKPHVTRRDLSDGDRLELHAVLYNPIANRFLNAPPGLRVDSRQLVAGYRYLFLNSDRPEVNHGHFATLDGALRINDLEVGLRFAHATFASHQLLDTFLGEGQGDFALDHRVIQVMALAKYPIWEKYSFANAKVGLAAGLTWSSAESSSRMIDKWTGALDAFVEGEVRLARLGDFSLDLVLELGFSYLGELPYLEKTFSPFGEGPETVANKHVFGPTGSAGLQLKWYNDIF